MSSSKKWFSSLEVQFPVVEFSIIFWLLDCVVILCVVIISEENCIVHLAGNNYGSYESQKGVMKSFEWVLWLMIPPNFVHWKEGMPKLLPGFSTLLNLV